MIAGALIGALALAATITGFAIWQAMRSAASSDARLKAAKESAKLERQLDAQSRALADRDRAIESLESTVASQKAKIAALRAQNDDLSDLLAKVKPDEVSATLRSHLERYKLLREVPEAGETGSR